MGNETSYTLPGPSLGSLNLPTYTEGTSITNVTATATFTLPLTVTATWMPSGGNDPAPAVLRVAENSSTGWNSTSTQPGFNTTGSAADDGFGDTPAWNGTYYVSMRSGSVQRQYSVPQSGVISWTRTLSATGTGTSNANVYGVFSSAALLSYAVSAISIPAALTVDQDQQVLPPAPTTRFSATVSNAPGFTIDWIKISVDGATPILATIPAGSSQGYIAWPSATAGNPSEHTVAATAQLHDSVGVISLNSTSALGNGRPADDVIADIKLKSLQFNNGVLLNQDAVTPVPRPEMTWNPATGSLLSNNPCAYLRGRHASVTMTLCDSAGAALTGSAVKGYALKIQAAPNTIDPTTSQPDPTLTLYDNSSGTPFAPTVCNSPIPVNCTALLYNWIAKYATTFPVLSFYVEFTKLPAPTWALVSSFLML